MRDLLQFLARYGHVITFFVLQVICFRFIISYNESQQEIYFFNKTLITAGIQDKLSEWNGYLKLGAVADSLAVENADLRSQLRDARFLQEVRIDTIADSLYRQQYEYIAAEVISNTVNLQNNYLLIDKGRSDSIMDGMGVISDKGVVGIVSHVSDRYARVLPLHNKNTRISVLLAQAGYFGGLNWSGEGLEDYSVLDIPRHAEVSVGDSILTSGYSVIFPKGIYLGSVYGVGGNNGTNFLDVTAELNINMTDLRHVYIVKNLYSDELKELMQVQ